MSIVGTLIVGAGAMFSRWVVEYDPVLNPWLWKWGHPVFMSLLIGSLIYACLRHLNPERRQAEEKRAQLAAIVESSSDAIYAKTIAGTVTVWSKGAQRLFGYAAEEMVGKPAGVLFPPDGLQEEEQILAQIRLGEKVPSHDSVRVARDGRVLNVSVSVSPIRDAQGTSIGAATIVRDRTQLVMAEQARHHAAQLAVLRERQELLAEKQQMLVETFNHVRNALQIVVYSCRDPHTAAAVRRLVEAMGQQLRENAREKPTVLHQYHDRKTETAGY